MRRDVRPRGAEVAGKSDPAAVRYRKQVVAAWAAYDKVVVEHSHALGRQTTLVGKSTKSYDEELAALQRREQRERAGATWRSAHRAAREEFQYGLVLKPNAIAMVHLHF